METLSPQPVDTAPPVHRAPAVLTLDIEDWFQVENLKAAIPRETWDSRELRVERNTMRLLELMDRQRVRSTCFVLGWVAERLPHLVRRIAEAGHEVASHGYGHELVYELSAEQFRQDVTRSVRVLEDLSGSAVYGYRAPSFSITEWAIDILREIGLRYDSSSFPALAHDRYGRLQSMPRGAALHELREGFCELGVSCLEVAGRSLPWGGGGYFRLLPYPVFRRGVQRILAGGRPYVFYLHPWEIDPGQPRMSGLRRSHAFRHYVHLDRCEPRLEALLRDFAWTRARDLLQLPAATV